MAVIRWTRQPTRSIPMRILAASLFVTTLLFALPERSSTAQEKPAPVKWEYAELSYRSTPGRGPGKDADGKEVPAKDGTITLRWTTGAEEISLKGWGELAEKLKVQLKKDSSAASQRLQVLNALGAAG